MSPKIRDAVRIVNIIDDLIQHIETLGTAASGEMSPTTVTAGNSDSRRFEMFDLLPSK